MCSIGLLGMGSLQPAATRADDQQSTKSTSEASECTITLDSGRTITGVLMHSDDESIVLRINGIDTTYRRTRIASIKRLPPVSERYFKLRESIPDTDIESRLILVDWLRDRRAYELAIEELDEILELHPNHPQASILRTWLEQHLKLTNAHRDPDTQSKPRRQASAPKHSVPMLTPEQINLIRVYELDLADPPRFRIEDSTIRTLMAQKPDAFPVAEQDREAILKGSDLDKLKLLFRNRARELYSEVQVDEDPESFKVFKKHIAGRTGWMLNSCATVRCHGGDDAGDFKLISKNPNSPESLYTNFVVIDRYKLSDGTNLINYTDPDRSPMVQLGMIRSRSLYPHPEVDPTEFGRDWKPVFRSSTSTNFKRVTDWIRSLYTPRPDYGFQYPPSSPDPETDPKHQDP
tara:strand:+ start:2132 stop:3346 length:1215 start_codon:yes stop_codon:yes gene_type:complete